MRNILLRKARKYDKTAANGPVCVGVYLNRKHRKIKNIKQYFKADLFCTAASRHSGKRPGSNDLPWATAECFSHGEISYTLELST